MARKTNFLWLFLIFFAALWTFLLYSNSNRKEGEKISVFSFYEIPTEVVIDFEKETGIRVERDIGDENETLEAKLLTKNSGYDIVFPSFMPYAARQALIGVYTKLDLNLLPNLKNIKGIITDKFKKAGGDTDYLIPLFWGTIGIAFNASLIERAFPDDKIEIDAYSVLFDEENLKRLQTYGVAFPREWIDIFPQTKAYLKINPEVDNAASAKLCLSKLRNFRKYVAKFISDGVVDELLSCEICAAVASSDVGRRAIILGKKANKKIKYVIPKDCPILWIDCVAIPEKSKNKENAHKFLNYIMNPQVAAKITNFSGALSNIPKAVEYFSREIKENDQVCPSDPELLKKLIIRVPPKSKEELREERKIDLAWSRIKSNSFYNEENDEE